MVCCTQINWERRGSFAKALREWLDKNTLGDPGWPLQILEWQKVPDTAPFESYLGELSPPREVALREILDTNVPSDFAPGEGP